MFSFLYVILTDKNILQFPTIISGWQYYQQQQAIAVEQACKEAEKYARFYILKAKSIDNTKSLYVLMKKL